ncbi:uncharacterized protein LOC129564961 [Sitodiplosis mosellana]|uniref:uncharacterized protein LOC129564961 n=1 Tax=Sitodiplosis mosellana TaxID=263140 RepID=UPI002443CE04|nr:uncharacterized protein LOC129564961 [Sitodiplosis mosellana]
MASSRESSHFSMTIENPDGFDSFLKSIIEGAVVGAQRAVSASVPASELADFKNRACPICNKMFASKKNRDRHIANIHKQRQEDDANETTVENGQNRKLNDSQTMNGQNLNHQKDCSVGGTSDPTRRSCTKNSKRTVPMPVNLDVDIKCELVE